MKLGELIERLRAHPNPDDVLSEGFHHAHSWRGVYAWLAFEPASDVTVRSMLTTAEGAHGTWFTGWKGGDFRMALDTPVFLSVEGTCGSEDEDELTATRLEEMLRSGLPATEPTPHQTAIGDRVMFVPECEGDCGHEPIHDRAAIVTRIDIFATDGRHDLSLIVQHPDAIAFRHNVARGEPGVLGTWYPRETT